MNKKEYYEQKALEYAEYYGILTYKVKGSFMIYNQNRRNKEFLGGKWVENPCTYQIKVNLDTMQTTVLQLRRLQKDGWDNV